MEGFGALRCLEVLQTWVHGQVAIRGVGASIGRGGGDSFLALFSDVVGHCAVYVKFRGPGKPKFH